MISISNNKKEFEYSNGKYFGNYKKTGEPYNPYKAREEAKRKEKLYGYKRYC